MNWENLLQGKVAVISGAASGIGFEISHLFAEHGATILLIDKDQQGLENLKNSIHSKISEKNKLFLLNVDVSDLSFIKKINKTNFPFLDKVDILVNNIGVDLFKDFFETSPEDYDFVNNINCRSSFFLTQKIANFMKLRSSGSIIFMSSANAILGNSNHAAYTVSKGGLVSLTRALAIDLGNFNINVNSICPGSIDTPMFDRAVKSGLEKPAKELGKIYPIGRVGRADEVANLVLFLASDLAKFITGANLPIDGGYSAK